MKSNLLTIGIFVMPSSKLTITLCPPPSHLRTLGSLRISCWVAIEVDCIWRTNSASSSSGVFYFLDTSSLSLTFNVTSTLSVKDYTLFTALRQCWTLSVVKRTSGYTYMAVLYIFILQDTVSGVNSWYNWSTLVITDNTWFISAPGWGCESRPS